MMQSSSSSIHGTTSRLIQSVKRLSQDSWSLVLAVARRKNNEASGVVTSNIKAGNNSIREQWRNALVTQAQQHNNTVAIKWLQWDKSWTLLKYHGPIKYMKQYHFFKFPSIDRKSRLGRLIWSDPTLLQQDIVTTNNNGSSNITDNATDDNVNVEPATTKKNKNNKIAKVAFMITSQQKLELQDRLGYNTKDIKGLTPMEATIILEHNIHRLAAQGGDETNVENFNNLDRAETSSMVNNNNNTKKEDSTTDVTPRESSSLPHYKIKVASILASMKEEEETSKKTHETESEAEFSSSPEDASDSTMTMQTVGTTTKQDDMPVAEKHNSLVESKSLSMNSASNDTVNNQNPKERNSPSSVVSLTIVQEKSGEDNNKQ